jgi:hypothetical protein
VSEPPASAPTVRAIGPHLFQLVWQRLDGPAIPGGSPAAGDDPAEVDEAIDDAPPACRITTRKGGPGYIAKPFPAGGLATFWQAEDLATAVGRLLFNLYRADDDVLARVGRLVIDQGLAVGIQVGRPGERFDDE